MFIFFFFFHNMSLPLSLPLSFCVSLHLSLSLPLFISLCPCLCPYLYLCLSLHVSLPMSLPVSLSVELMLTPGERWRTSRNTWHSLRPKTLWVADNVFTHYVFSLIYSFQDFLFSFILRNISRDEQFWCRIFDLLWHVSLLTRCSMCITPCFYVSLKSVMRFWFFGIRTDISFIMEFQGMRLLPVLYMNPIKY